MMYTRAIRVLIVARPYDLSDAVADAFVDRHTRMVELLRSHFAVQLLGLRTDHDEARIASRLADLDYSEVVVPAQTRSRGARLRRATRRMVSEPLADWERQILLHAERFGPDAVASIGPWLDVEYRSLFQRFPAVHLHEEDLTRMPDIAPQSWQARLLRHLEDIGRRRAGMRPAIVVAISEAEIEPARRRYPGARVELIRFTLDPAQWPIADSVSDGHGVVVVGNLAQERNTEGLVAVLHELRHIRRQFPVEVNLVSGAGLHPTLEPFLSEDWVRYEPNSVTPYAAYRRAGVALVPSTRATGFKTTVLQAWVAGCPVICSAATAATLGANSVRAIDVGRDATELVTAIVRTLGNDERRRGYAYAGIELARSLFSDEAESEHLLNLVSGLSGRAAPHRARPTVGNQSGHSGPAGAMTDGSR